MSNIFFTPMRLPLLLGGFRDTMAIFKREDMKTLRIGTAFKFANTQYKVVLSETESITATDLRTIADKLDELNGVVND